VTNAGFIRCHVSQKNQLRNVIPKTIIQMSLKTFSVFLLKTTGPAEVRYFEQEVPFNNKKSYCIFPLVTGSNKQQQNKYQNSL
jgi:hypothetical protein